ncbi:MAG: dTDP-4-dehydrorhamnose 3,5-epimerase [Bdellovibrionales bacterium]|nr:dTDP-4-dehydrorhamnose 3,5-epimerase [Bdellovibrionales bacterium]
MNRIETGIEGLVILEPKVFGDERGFFMETFNAQVFKSLGLPTNFVQDNHSRSQRGVLRGLHSQNPNPQGKLVRVVTGAVWDVAVDVRKGSPTFGKYYGLELSAENKKIFYVPEGFLHGFCVLSDTADFVYKCTALYAPTNETGVHWADPTLNIPWPIKDPLVSGKDQKLGSLADYRKLHQL